MRIDNRFDLLRLVFAGLVMVYHGVALSGLLADSRTEIWLAHIAELSIQGFFILSGALVTSSYVRSVSVLDYAAKRVRRLYPAYAVVILLPAVFSLGLTGQLLDVLRYVGANLLFLNFLEPNLPGLFADNRFTAVNGALWTLKIEVMFYICLPVLMWFLSRLKSWWPVLIILLYAGGETWRMLMPQWVDGPLGQELARQLPGQMAFFACGMAMCKVWESLPPMNSGMVLIGLLGLVVTLFAPHLAPLRPIALTCAIAVLAFAPGWKPAASKYGDVSYGLYITHFPVFQTFAALGLFTRLGLWWGVIVATGVVLVASFALWHMVEKRALRPTSHYRRV